MALQKINQPPPLVNHSVNPDAERLVDQVFKMLLASCPSMKNWTAEEIKTAKQQWVLGFAENCITTVEQVRAGMMTMRAKTDDFVPSVGKFISWCKGNEYRVYGLPEPSELLPRLEQFKDRWFKPIDYRSNAEYWLLSAIERKQKANIWIKTEELQKFAEAELNSVLAKLKQGVQYGKPETKELDKPRKPKLSPKVRSAKFREHLAKAGIKL